MFVLTVDQRHSRQATDRVDELLEWLAGRGAAYVRPFERTAGDEVQGIHDDPDDLVAIVLALVRADSWSVGVGVGAVNLPLPPSTRAGAGPAFVLARDAVTRAKSRPSGLAVAGEHPEPARRAQTALDLLAAILLRRTGPGWEAVDLAARGLSQSEVATRLGVTKQAVSQRLRSAEWHIEPAARALASHLLSEADATVGTP